MAIDVQTAHVEFARRLDRLNMPCDVAICLSKDSRRGPELNVH
jgi:hypothetical protein